MFEHEKGTKQNASQDIVVIGHGGDAEQEDSREEAIVLEVNVINHEESSIAQQQ